MSVAPKTKKPKSRRRRRDEDPGSGDDSDASAATSSRSGSASGGESGSEDEVDVESEHDEDRDENHGGTEKEPARAETTESHDDDASVASHASNASEPEEIPFEEFNASPTQPPTDQESQTSTPTPRPAPAPRQSNRQAYLSRIASDPTFVPRVGKFWTHDQRLYAGGKVGQGDMAGLREMSEYWRGRGRGFASGARGGRGRGAARNTGSGESRNPSSSEARNPSSSEASNSPIPEKDPQSTESTDTPPVPSSATASATKWTAADPGRSDRGSWAHDGYAQLAREEEMRAAARERSQRGRGGRGMVRGMFRGRGRGGVAPQVHAVAPVTPVEAASAESAPVEATASASSPPVDTPSIAAGAANPPFSDHEPSAITAHLQSQAEQAESIQQQQLADAAARLSLSPHPHTHAQSPRPASGPPTILPPGIAMHPSGTFYDIHTGQPVVWVPSPSPNVPRYPEPYQQQAYPQQPNYPYPPYPYYRPQEYYPSPQQFQRNDSPFMPYPAVDPTYFIPPRPQSKIEIRAPGQPPSNPNPIAAATLKDSTRFASQGGYQQGGYQGYEYGTMGISSCRKM